MIVACGEALIDFVPALTQSGEPGYVARPGGSPFNVAVTLGRLGVRAGFLGSVSTDFFGTRLLGALRDSDVDTRYVERLERPSTLAFVNLTATEPEYAFYDREAAHRFWTPGVELAADVAILHFSFGALLPIDEPAGGNFASLMARSKGRRIVTLDPNIRPGVMHGREAAYRARLQTLLGSADLIKISAADLDWLDLGRSPADVAAQWLRDGAALVVVTSGGAGSTAYARSGLTVACAAQPIALVDTVGAGDSFMGALLAALDMYAVTTPERLAALDADALADVLRFATRVAAITCSRAGADPPWRADVELPAGARS